MHRLDRSGAALRFAGSRRVRFFTPFTWVALAAAALAGAALALTGLTGDPLAVWASSEAAASVEVTDAWARPGIASGNSAAYFTLTNRGDAPVTLLGASSPVARFTELHETYVVTPGEHEAGEHDAHHHHHDHGGHESAPAGTILGMRAISRLTLEPGESVAFLPGGYHVMLIDLVDDLGWDQQFPLTLEFEGFSVTAYVTVGDGPAHAAAH